MLCPKMRQICADACFIASPAQKERNFIMDFIYQPNRIYAADETGKVVAEVTFPSRSENVVEITHTFVDDSLRGQGIAGQLMAAVVEKLRNEQKKAFLSCSYAVKWFESHPEAADVEIKKSL